MSEQNDRRDERRAPFGATRMKVWTGLGTVMLAGAALSLAPHAPAAGPLGKLAQPMADAAAPLPIAGDEGGEGGEGSEGGEGGAAADPGADDVAYLTQLGLMRGHLDVGLELYRQGERAAAEAHLEHALENLNDALEPAVEERGASEFEDRLEVLENLVEDDAPAAQIEAAGEDVLRGIETAEAAVPEAERNAPATRFAVVVELVRAAAEAYAAAVRENGQVVDAVDYQTALGYVRSARALLDATPEDSHPAAAEAIAKARTQLDEVSGLWPGAMPPATVEGDASALYGAAANIEIAALKLQ